LVVRCKRLEERGDVDDVGVSGDGKRLSDLSGNQDVTIAFLQMIVFVLHAIGVVVSFC
jgi:hypothetical protein